MELKKLPELLAPAGSPDALYAAIDAGADAVYLGARGFNARMNAANFSDDELAAGIIRAHRFGVKVYATLNTLVHDRELPAFLATARALYDAGVDGVIVADLGAMAALARELPDLPVHASTQASVHSLDGALAMAALGCTRVVPARELSLTDIRTLTTHAPLEIEVFVHGALCVCYSGQCLFSSLVGGRSGNRGECAQPCRLPYNGGYPLSLRDLSLASHIPALIDAGISSLKIEGRMKSAAYVYGVTGVYRRLLDERRAATREEEQYLSELFSRGGFTDGYFTGKIARGMVGVRSDADKEKSRALPPPPPFSRKIPLTASLCVRAGEASKLTFIAPDGRVGSAVGDAPDEARSIPLSREGLYERIAKLGGTDYTLKAQDCDVTLDGGLFLTPASLNALRRAAIEDLDAKDESRKKAGAADASPRPIHAEKVNVDAPLLYPREIAVCHTEEQARAAQNAGVELVFLPLHAYLSAGEARFGVSMPPVVHDHERARVMADLARARELGASVALATNVGQIAPLREMGFTVVGDLRLNVYNRKSAALLRDMGVSLIIPSPELSLPQLRDLGVGAATVYGRLPLMLTERCFVKENFGCDACEKAAFTDRRGARFPVLREAEHRNLIVNSIPTYMGDRKEDLDRAGIKTAHFFFSVESGREVEGVLAAYRAGAALGMPVRRIGRN